MDCGYVQVPEDRDRPGGAADPGRGGVRPRAVGTPGTDPIVFLDGGPSFGAISPFALDLYFAGASFATDRDLVLVDTRGTGFSTPRLGCPELDQAEVDAFYTGPSVDSRAGSIYARALRECRARLVAAGVDPAAYDTTESAADLEALRRALDVRRWNLLAISADGNLGLTYMRMFPGGIRSAVIDSGTSTNVLWGLDYDRGRVAQLERVFAGCRANPACRATYPDIRRELYRLVREYNRHPLYLTIEDFQPEPATFPIDGAGLLTDAVNLIYPGDAGYEETHPPPPRRGLVLGPWWRRGGYRAALGTGPVENSHADDALAQGKSMSTCAATWSASSPGRTGSTRPATSPRTREGTSTWVTTSPTAGATPSHRPAAGRGGWAWPTRWSTSRFTSAIPTLVLAGEYDGGVPPGMVRPMLPGLSRATYVELPAAGHLQLASYTNGSDCARAIADAFLDSSLGQGRHRLRRGPATLRLHARKPRATRAGSSRGSLPSRPRTPPR